MVYSQDLLDRVIDAVLVEGMSRRAAAARYGVSETAAINWVKRAELTGSRTPAKLGGYKPMMLRRIGRLWKLLAASGLTLRLVFIDETWTKTNMTRLHGWADKRLF